MAGAFRVYEEPDNSRDIRFEVLGSEAAIPSEQVALRDSVVASLNILRIAVRDEARFREYFAHLLALAQMGLVGDSANPLVADRVLAQLKDDVVAREAGRIKNAYLRQLGLRASIGVLALLAALEVFRHLPVKYLLPEHICVYLAGTMLGVWLSFGTKKTTLKFEELHVLEEDRLDPSIRLIFMCCLAFVLFLLFYLGVISVSLGELKSDALVSKWSASLLFGILAGLAEKALPGLVGDKVSSLMRAQ